jgi:hypothetical protein
MSRGCQMHAGSCAHSGSSHGCRQEAAGEALSASSALLHRRVSHVNHTCTLHLVVQTSRTATRRPAMRSSTASCSPLCMGCWAMTTRQLPRSHWPCALSCGGSMCGEMHEL